MIRSSGWGRWLVVMLLVMPSLPGAGLTSGAIAARPVPDHQIDGVVLDQGQRPVALASVVLVVDRGDDRAAPEFTITSQTDPQGRFQFNLPDQAACRGAASLWAVHPGLRLTRVSVASTLLRQSVRIRLDPVVLPAVASLQVKNPRGSPTRGARVVPTRWVESRLGAARPRQWTIPAALGEQIAATTDDNGRVQIAAVPALRLAEVCVETAEFGTQDMSWDDSVEGRHHEVWLHPVGKVFGQVTGNNLADLAGLVVHVETTVGTRRVGWATTRTTPTGQFEFNAIPAGTIEIKVEPRANSLDLPEPVPRQELAAGSSISAMIPLRAGVRIAGVVRELGQGPPIADVSLELHGPGPLTWPTRTDGQGRFAVVVRPGAVTARVTSAPDPFLVPTEQSRRDLVGLSPGDEAISWPAIELVRGVMLRGRTVDGSGQTIASALEVEARWTQRSGRSHDEIALASTSSEAGEFVVGPVAGGVAVDLDVRLPVGITSAPMRLEGEQIIRQIDLVVPRSNAQLAPTGRVVDTAGQAVAGALIQFWVADRTHPASIRGSKPGRRLVIAGLDTVVSDSNGFYAGAPVLEHERTYLASAEATDCESGRTRPVAPHSLGASKVHFPDLVLQRQTQIPSLVGQVLDRRRRPIAGVTITDLDRHETSTNAAGYFTLEKTNADGPVFLFANKAGYRFCGRSLSAQAPDAARPLTLELQRRDETESPTPVEDQIDQSGPQFVVDWMLRMLVVNPLVGQVLARNDQVTSALIFERLARVEPHRVLNWLDANAVRDHRVADGLRRIAAPRLAAVDFDGAKHSVARIDDIRVRCLAGLEIVAAARLLPAEQRVNEVEQVTRDAHAIEDIADRVVVLSQVAHTWIILAERDRARLCLQDAEEIAQSLPKATSGARAWCALIGPLAELDTTQARARLNYLVDPADLDRSRLKIAQSLGSRDPRAAIAIFRRIKSRSLQVRHTPQLCYQLAATNAGQARELVDSIAISHPPEAAYALGMMAAALAQSDRPQATQLIHEAYSQLEAIHTSSDPGGFETHVAPALVGALLLPVVNQVDPASFHECLWKSVALLPAKNPPSPQLVAILALLLDRYDREVARHLFDPSRLNIAIIAPRDVAPLILAAAQIAPDVACRWIFAPPAPHDSRTHAPLLGESPHVELAAALTLTDLERWNQVAHQILQLWTPDLDSHPQLAD